MNRSGVGEPGANLGAKCSFQPGHDKSRLRLGGAVLCRLVEVLDDEDSDQLIEPLARLGNTYVVVRLEVGDQLRVIDSQNLDLLQSLLGHEIHEPLWVTGRIPDQDRLQVCRVDGGVGGHCCSSLVVGLS